MSSRSSSRRGLWLLGLPLAAWWLSSCTPKVGEAPPPQKVQELSGTACLAGTAEVAKDFLIGDAKDEDLVRGWDCLIASFDLFEKKVRGNSQSEYTSRELATFLEDNFLPRDESGAVSQRISDPLLLEFMKFKQIFIGGSRQTVTRAELLQSLKVFSQLKDITRRLNPHMKILVMNWNKSSLGVEEADLERFEQANQEFQVAARELGGLVEIHKQAYRLDDLSLFFEELGRFYGESWELIHQIRQFMPVAKKVKKALAGGDEDFVEPSQWKTVLVLGGRAYIQFLRYHYFIETPARAGATLKLAYVAKTLEDSLSTMEDLVRLKATGSVTRLELDEILAALGQAWDGFKTSEPLLDEVMKLKQVLVGGDFDRWAVTDFETARLKISVLTPIFERIFPYYALYAEDWDPGALDPAQAMAEFEKAAEALETSGRELGAHFETSYNLEDFQVLVDEFEKLYPPTNAEDPFSATVKQYLPLFIQIKKSVYMEEDPVVRKPQWVNFLRYASRYYMITLYNTYFLNREGPATHLMPFVDRILVFARDLVTVKGSEVTVPEMGPLLATISQVWPNFRMSQGLLLEAMKLKLALVGGSGETISAADLEAARAKIPQLWGLVDQLKPHLDLYMFGWSPDGLDTNTAFAAYDAASAALVGGLTELGRQFVGPYDLRNLPRLLSEFDSLYPQPMSKSNAKGIGGIVESFLPLLYTVKKVVFEEETLVLQPRQTPIFLSITGRLYLAFLFNFYFLDQRDYREVRTLLAVRKLGDQILVLLEDILKERRQKTISRAELMLILREVEQLGILPEGFTPEVIEKILGPALNRFFLSPEKRLAGEKPDGIRAATIESIRSDLRVWVDTQIFFVRLFGGSDRQELSPDRLNREIREGIASSSSSASLKTGLRQVQEALDTWMPLIFDEKGRLLIPAPSREGYTLRSLEKINLLRVLVGKLISSYAGDLNRAKNRTGLTLNESKRAFQDVRPLVVSLGLVAADDTSFVDSRFRDLNLFTSRANGDQFASRGELVDLFAMLLSGVAVDSLLRPGLVSECWGDDNPSPARPGSRIGTNCLYSYYKRGFRSHFVSLPIFQAYQRAQTDAAFRTFFLNALKSSGWVPGNGQYIKFSELSLLPHLIQYVELLYARFDRDRNGAMTATELVRAFPLFEPMLKQLAKKEIESGTIQEKELLALFTYILHHGRPPNGLWEGLTKWGPWKGMKPEDWPVSTDRNRLAEILGYIADEMAKPKEAEAPAQKKS